MMVYNVLFQLCYESAYVHSSVLVLYPIVFVVSLFNGSNALDLKRNVL